MSTMSLFFGSNIVNKESLCAWHRVHLDIGKSTEIGGTLYFNNALQLFLCTFYQVALHC